MLEQLAADTRLMPTGPAAPAAAASTAAISVLLVGAGRRGLSAHLPALLGSRFMRLASVVDTPQRASELRATSALAVPMFDSIDDAVSSGAPDLAIVATPHDCHVPIALSLLRWKIPTLLEKPPARNSSEFSILVQASQHHATPLATLRPFLYEPRRRQFVRLLRSPELTDAVISVRGTVPSWPGVGEWRLSRQRAGGGVLIDLGYHYLDIFVACLGQPDARSVRLRASGPSGEVEDEATVRLEFDARRIVVGMSFRAGTDVSRSGELSITDKEQRIVYSSAIYGRPENELRQTGGSSKLVSYAIRRQIDSLLETGFLDGNGDWLAKLVAQAQVMSLLDDLYAEAVFLSPTG